MITTPDHLLRRENGAPPICKGCQVSRSIKNIKKRASTDELFRRKLRQRTERNRKRANDATIDAAHRRHQQWTGPELEMAARTDMTAREVAIAIGRSIYSVKHMRRKLKADDPIKTFVAGLSHRLMEEVHSAESQPAEV